MFVAVMFASTTTGELVFKVVDGFTGRVVLTTRRPGVAVTVAARCNTGVMRVFSSDFCS
jgi:hypothetical protein